MDISVLEKYFELSSEQKSQMVLLATELLEWNSKINLISRKDTDNLVANHILHSLAIAKYCNQVKGGTSILDLGTGGGFPGLPLAILWPQAKFLLVDARGKKIMVVQDLIQKIGLSNCQAEHIRVEDIRNQSFHYVVSRAVAPLQQLMEWSRHLYTKKQLNAIPNGLICLKGGDIDKEIKSIEKQYYGEAESISQYFEEPFFEEKHVIYVQSY